MKMSGRPSKNGGNGGKGRGARGRFVKGNKAAVGHGGRIHTFRVALLAAVSAEDIGRIAKRLVKQAENGNIQAARLLFAYALGQPFSHDIFERIEALESLAEGLDEERKSTRWLGGNPYGG